MKAIVGILFMLGALALGVFVGGYVMLYGGIVQVIDGATADPVNSSDIALGAMRALFFELGGVLAAAIPFIIGTTFLHDAARHHAGFDPFPRRGYHGR